MPEEGKYKNFDDIKCQWMKCGAVDYKICDNNFDCENCSFDKLVVSRLKLKGNILEEIETLFNSTQRSVSFTHPYYHFSSGLIAKNFLGNNYCLGLEPVIVKFIDRGSSVNYSIKDMNIKKGDPVLNIRNGWGEINVLSPFCMRIVEKLDLKNIFLNDIHWFAVIETTRQEILGNSISGKIYYEKLYETKKHLKDTMKIPGVTGKTMYDGGTVIENWADILGKTAYKILMEKFFS